METLRAGDLVMTLDGGAQPLIWVGATHLDAAALDLRPDLRPIRITPDALAPGQPRRPLELSPQHRILRPGGLAHARHLWRAGHPGIRRRGAQVQQVTYWHLALADHHILWAEGALVESFFPGPQALRALPAAARARLIRALPALATGHNPMRPARPFLRFKDLTPQEA